MGAGSGGCVLLERKRRAAIPLNITFLKSAMTSRCVLMSSDSDVSDDHRLGKEFTQVQ